MYGQLLRQRGVPAALVALLACLTAGCTCSGTGHDRDASFVPPPPDGANPACPAPEGPGLCVVVGDASVHCAEWAARVGAGWVDPSSMCTVPGDGPMPYHYCLRANDGYPLGGLNTATCGGHRPCEVHEVCARRAAGQPFECLPCTAN